MNKYLYIPKGRTPFRLEPHAIYKVRISSSSILFYENKDVIITHSLSYWNAAYADAVEVNIKTVATPLFRLLLGTPKVIK